MKLKFPVKSAYGDELTKDQVLQAISNVIDFYESTNGFETRQIYSCTRVSAFASSDVALFYNKLIIKDGTELFRANTSVPFHHTSVDNETMTLTPITETDSEIINTNRIIALNLLYIAISKDWEI